MSDVILQKLAGLEAKLDAVLSGAGRARVRGVKCTQGEFERLPALVGRAEFIAWTGYDKDELAEEVKGGRIRVYRPEGHVRARYFKAEIARLGGWKM